MTEEQVSSQEGTNPIAGEPTSPTKPYVPDPTARFRGIGINFRGKLIGIDEVSDSRGDQMCQESLLKLKAAVKASGQHKQKVVINVSLEGIKIIDMLSGQVEHVHPVHRISFISRDLTDRRAFGYVFGVGDGVHQFFGIKTLKVAETLVLALRDLFQVVYDLKKKEMEAKDTESTTTDSTPTKQAATESSGLVDLQNELNHIKEGIETIDAIGPWTNNVPTSPDTPGFPMNDSNGDMFGANLSDISSLSSEFSCASNTIIDYGYAGGGRNGNNFVRSGSSRSEQSLQGNLNQSLRSSTKSKIINENLAITEENELSNSNKSGDTHSDTSSSKNSAKFSSDDNSFFSEVMNAAGIKPEVNEPKETVKSVSTDDVSSTDSKSKHRSSKKNSAFSGLFKSKSEKSKKKKNKKNSDATSSTSSIGSKSEDDKMNNRIQLRTSSASLSAQSTPTKTLSQQNSSNQLERTHSHTSINSSKSYSVVSTDNIKRGNSNTSLVSAPGIMDSSKKSLEHIHTSIGLAIEQKKASLVPRARPNVKHKSMPEEKPNNPPMFKTHKDDSVDESDKKKSVSEAELTANLAKWENLDDSFGKFDDFKTNLKNENKSNDNLQDPFAELEKQKLPVSNSVEGFGDSAWAVDSAADTNNKGNTTSPIEEDPFADDPFKDEPVDNTHGLSGTNTNNSDPFDKIDPFTLDMDENENLFLDPFENVSLEDPFQENSNSNDLTLTEDTLKFHLDNEISSDDLSAREPTFPEGSENIIAKNKVKEKDLADSSSITSGLSTPIHNPSSPVHAPDIAQAPSTTTVISPTPPPLPPRKRKVPPINIEPTCPAIPPPPLPADLEINEDEDILPPNFTPPALPPDVIDFQELDAPKLPPAIPLRKNESPMNNSSWQRFSDKCHHISLTRNKTLPLYSNVPVNTWGVGTDVESSTSSSSIWPHSTQSSEDRNSSNCSSGSDVTNNAEKESYSNDLMALNQVGKTKPNQLSNDQILQGFGSSQPTGMNMYGNQGMGGMQQAGFGMQQPGMMPGMQHGGMGMMAGQQGMMAGQQGMMAGQQGMMAGQQSMMVGQQSMSYSQPMQAGFGAQPGFNAGGFPQAAPSIPPRRPAPANPMGMAPDPFGGFNSGNSTSMFPSSTNSSVLNPKSTQPQEETTPKKNDPFADIGAMTGIASPNSSSKKDMFKDFKMAKPQAPPRTSIGQAEDLKKSASSDLFDNYFASNVGGMPVQIDDANNNMSAPIAKPRQADPFSSGGVPMQTQNSTNDAFIQDFGSFNFDTPTTTNQPPVQSSNNLADLFG